MSLIKCRECNKEISSEAKICPNCGVKNPFKKKRTWKDYVFALIFGLIVVAIFGESGTEKKEKIELLEKTVKTIPITNVEENFRSYEELSSYYPNNVDYKEKTNFYKSRLDLKKECMLSAYKSNENSLRNKSTFKTISLDEYLEEKWFDIDTFIYQSSFSGKNSFGIEQKFVAKYKCYYNNGKPKIERIILKEI